jgi:hypothetical protein
VKRNAPSTIHSKKRIIKRLKNRVARAEYVALLEAGFTYVSDYEGGLKVLRKRK